MIVAKAMITSGDGFLSNLGKALSFADCVDAGKIKEAFPKYWVQYKNIARTKGVGSYE